MKTFPKPLTAEEEKQYLKRLQNGDKKARQVLIEYNLRLVAHIAKKYQMMEADMEELVSIVAVGLNKAVDTFEQEKASKLATYAARCVENEILMYFRAGRKSAQDVSLSDYIDTGTDGAPLALQDVVSEDTDLMEQVAGKESVRNLRRAMDSCLTEQEQLVIRLRYGLGTEEPLRQREVADRTGISRSYVSRIEKRALGKLRAALE